jgi:hypothetical protein
MMPNTSIDYTLFDEVAVQRLVREIRISEPITAADAAEAVRRLARDGYSDGQIAYKLGFHRRSIVRIRQRLKIRAALTPMQNRFDRIHDSPNRPRAKG